jgi:two-component system, response regulator, stage 0 sporulation protein F
MSNRLKLIYVDDEEMNRQLFRLLFEKKYEVITAESGVIALTLLENHQDTVAVVSDMKMPAMSGIEFIQKAKKKFPYIKFFILTGYDITAEIQEALKTNLILNKFRKPFNFNEIDHAIKMAFK